MILEEVAVLEPSKGTQGIGQTVLYFKVHRSLELFDSFPVFVMVEAGDLRWDYKEKR
jgi:hypothetical protein